MVETATNNLDIGKEFRVVSHPDGLPTSRKDVSVLGPVKHHPPSVGPLALLDRSCARRSSLSAAVRKPDRPLLLGPEEPFDDAVPV